MKQPTYRMQRVRIANCRVASNAYGGGGVAETTWIGHFMHDRWMLAKDIVLAGFKKEVAR